ncbi:MAG: hypothetical protein EBU27_04260 [Opitutae bacterium]|nr:hypothetical protein [Opitutae bacterium]
MVCGVDIAGFKGHRLFGIKGFTKSELYKLDGDEYFERVQKRFPLLKFVPHLIFYFPLTVQIILVFILEK